MWDFLKITKPKLAITSKNFEHICQSIFASFADIWSLIKNIIRNASPINGSPFFDQIARDRGIKRIKNESLHAYQARIRYAFKFLKYSSTLQGITDIISTVIPNKSFTIRELYQENFILGDPTEELGITTIINSSQQRFYFVVDIHDLTDDEEIYLDEIIRLYRPAHVQFRINNIQLGGEHVA
ncbi:MAG: hypothetical protein ACRCS8_02090 [Brevinema sp.]